MRARRWRGRPDVRSLAVEGSLGLAIPCGEEGSWGGPPPAVRESSGRASLAMEGVVGAGVRGGDRDGPRGGRPPAAGRWSGRAPPEVRGSSGRAPPVEEGVSGAARDWGSVEGVVRAVEWRGRRTSLTSVQCEPLPVKPAGQGPQRAPLSVWMQATPGKQKPGAQWSRGRTLGRPVRTDCCIPVGGGGDGGGADRGLAWGRRLSWPRPGAGGFPSPPAPPPQAARNPALSAIPPQRLCALPAASPRSLPESLSRFSAPWRLSLPQNSRTALFVSFCLFVASVSFCLCFYPLIPVRLSTSPTASISFRLFSSPAFPRSLSLSLRLCLPSLLSPARPGRAHRTRHTPSPCFSGT